MSSSDPPANASSEPPPGQPATKALILADPKVAVARGAQFVGEHAKRVGGGYPLTLTGALAVLLLLSLPQVHRLFKITLATACWQYTTLFVAYLVGIAVLLFVGVRAMLRARISSTSATRSSGKRAADRPRPQWFVKLINRIAELPHELEARFGKHRVKIGLGLFVAATIWFFVPAMLLTPTALSLDLAIRVWPCILLAFFGFRLIWHDVNQHCRSAAIQFVWLVSASLLFGELLWMMPNVWAGPFSYRLYSVWAIAFILFLLLATPLLIETVVRTVLLRALVVSVFVVYLLQSTVVAIPVKAAAVLSAGHGTPSALVWLTALQSRIDRAPPGPLLWVAASGGGSRAAIYTSLVLELLDNTPHPRGGTVGESVVVISSVSGGSLASAYYLTRRQGQLSYANRREWQNSTQSEIAQQMKQRANQYLEIAAKKKLDAARLGEYSRVATDVRGLPDRAVPGLPWLLDSAFVDDMATDFMAPLLRGILTPLLERGESVASFWDERFKLKLATGTVANKSPLAIFNVTDVDTGRRVVVGFPSVPQVLLGEDAESVNTSDGSVDLVDAVRLSANFPWGFDVAELQAAHKRYRLIDGGVLDNTGIDSLTLVVDRLSLLADRDAKSEDVLLARDVRQRLQTRGVILLEIDSGAHPAGSPLLSFIAPSVAHPLDALARAGYGNAENIKRSYIEAMRSDLLDVEQSAQHRTESRGLIHIPFVCNRDDSVMTAWALDPDAKARLLVLFLLEQAQQLPKLITALEPPPPQPKALSAAPIPPITSPPRAVQKRLNVLEVEKTVQRKRMYQELSLH